MTTLVAAPLSGATLIASPLGTETEPSVGRYQDAIMAMAPDASWSMDDWNGATFLGDSGGSSYHATVAGSPVLGALGLSPGGSERKSVYFAGQGRAALADASVFNFTTIHALSFVATVAFSDVGTSNGGFLFHKAANDDSAGYHLLGYSTVLQFSLFQSLVAKRVWTCPRPTPGTHLVALSFGGSIAVKPRIWIDGVEQTVTLIDATGTPTTMTSSNSFTLGGRSNGVHFRGYMQDAAFWMRAITADEVATLWASHEVISANAQYAPFIHSTDSGSGDIDDLPPFAYLIRRHQIGQIRLLGVMVDTGDVYTAPAARAILDYYGLTDIPVGAYMGTDCHVGGAPGDPSRTIRDAFRPSDTRANPIYLDPLTFYSTLLAAEDDDTVTINWDGPPSAEAQFLNASAANRTLWGQKVKSVHPIGGQFPNSSDAASPAGNYAAASIGNWNFGGTNQSSVNVAIATAAAAFVALSTPPTYWSGIEICGGTGNSPAIATRVSNSMPANWTTANPIRLGFGPFPRPSWGVMGVMAAVEHARSGADNNIYYTLNRITAPVISTVLATAGQNTSAAGSTDNWYLTPKYAGALTIANWRTYMADATTALMCSATP